VTTQAVPTGEATTGQQEILTALSGIIEEIAEVPAAEVTMQKRFVDDLNIDSLSMLEIAAHVEATYELDVETEALADLLTVGDVVELIQRERS
jgi:acyl carrier protein